MYTNIPFIHINHPHCTPTITTVDAYAQQSFGVRVSGTTVITEHFTDLFFSVPVPKRRISFISPESTARMKDVVIITQIRWI
jgi:hypothetical protein